MGGPGGEVAARPGREPAAERGELERLREEPQREATGPELVLQVRPEHACLHQRRPAGRVDLQHPAHRAEVEADRAGVLVADSRLDPTDDRRPAAEGDDGDPGVAAPVEDLGDLGLAGGPDDQVRDGVESAEQRAHDVAEGPAVTVGEPVRRVLGRQDGERVRWPDPARRHRERLHRRCLVPLEVGAGEQRRDPSGQLPELAPRHRALDVAPAPPRPGHHALLAQVAAEVGHRERDLAALPGVDQPLLEQRVAGRRERLRLLAQHPGHLRRRDRAHRVVRVVGSSGPAASAIARR